MAARADHERTSELSAEEIFDRCKNGAPANCPVEAAIDAHKIALTRFLRGDEGAKRVATLTLAAVLLAATKSPTDDRDKLEYLSGLPDGAWPSNAGYTPLEIRDDTLAGLSRRIEQRARAIAAQA